MYPFSRKKKRGCGTRLGCFLFLLLLFLIFFCSLLVFAARSTSALENKPYAVHLLIDNSNSLFEKAGTGSDPDLLRIDAARLFITYLGLDESDTAHALSVVFFGSEPQLVVPLTPLTDDRRRLDIFSLINQPPRMGWTDHVAALSMARNLIEGGSDHFQPALILLTDGKPEWSNTSTQTEKLAYAAHLKTEGEAFAHAGIPVFIVLLANETTDSDIEIQALWQPMWQEITSAVPPGRFYTAREPGDLIDIYHDIVVQLIGGQTAGMVLEKPDALPLLREVVPVESGLSQVTFVISKENPETVVTISTPNGSDISPTDNEVRFAGSLSEEVWVVANPEVGNWTIVATGPGRVTVWKDFQQMPTPLPSGTPTSTPISSPTSTSQSIVAAPASTATLPLPPTLRPILPTAVQSERELQTAVSTPITPKPNWLFLLLLIPIAATLIAWRKKQDPARIVTGTLHLIGESIPNKAARTFVLDEMQKTAVSIGPTHANIPLPNCTSTITIQVNDLQNDAHQLSIEGVGDVLLDGYPLVENMPLTDNALVVIKPYQFRYENLRLRTDPNHLPIHQDHSQDVEWF